MNHFRSLHPDYKAAPRRRTVGADDSEQEIPESMTEFAARARKAREELYHKSQLRARSKGRSRG